MPDRLDIARNWLPRYTGMPLDDFGDYILLTNFQYYVERFSEQFDCNIEGLDRPMQAATNMVSSASKVETISLMAGTASGPMEASASMALNFVNGALVN